MIPWLAGGIGFLLGRASKSCDCRQPYTPGDYSLRRDAARLAAAEPFVPPSKVWRLLAYVSLGVFACYHFDKSRLNMPLIVSGPVAIFTLVNMVRLLGEGERERIQRGLRVFDALPYGEQIERMKHTGWRP